MTPNPVHRLPAPLEAAVQRLKLAAREAAERTIESLGLAALASNNAFQRDGLLGAQFELNRKSAVFVLTFNEAFDERVLRELGPRAAGADALAPVSPRGTAPAAGMATNWAALTLVEDKEVEAQISAERFGLEVAHDCEWELRELDGYVGGLLNAAGGERDRNPLRPELVGHALIRGLEAVSERPEIRKLLAAELSRSLAGLLRACYADMVAELRNAGVTPLGMAVRNRRPRAAADRLGDGDSAQGSAADIDASQRGGRGPGSGDGSSSIAGGDSRRGAPGHAGFGASTRSGGQGSVYGSAHPGMPGYGAHQPGWSSTRGGSSRSGTPIGRVDPGLMSLIRRLAHVEGGDSGGGWDEYALRGSPGDGSGASGGNGPLRAPLPNLIRAHRDELRQAASGSPDHIVIDLIGFLFDQILADPKVPPQLARQIARLQLPVLRAALGDASFFSSRRHPVRRFINRIASLGAAFEDFGDDAGRSFLAKVRALVQEVVEGDFDQLETYELKLAELEAFTAENAARESSLVGGTGDAAALLAEKEDQQRLRQLYAERLAGELKDLAAPPFLREFITRIWSQVLMRAGEQGGPNGAAVQRLRGVASTLFLSVQPKATPAHRKAFLAELPRLMQDLTEGMNLIGWPEAQRRAFFGQLMPAHAEALKSPAGRQLDINLLARQVDGALQRPPPSRDDLRAARQLPVLTDEIAAPQFSAEEARRAGLVEESAVDWDGTVDIDLGSEPADADEPAHTEPATVSHPVLSALPAPTEPPEPTEGRALADTVQIGFAYQMHLDGRWQKVKLAHVSAARSFFIFQHGARHKKTVSLTQRMLQRLCETGRFKAFEPAYLLDRATARARRQLAAVAGS